MARLLYLATILLTISLVFAEDSDTSDSDSSPSDTEGKAGEAIKSLLQEKITQKFKEAANEVKGVLVKQLGDSLKSAHDVFKQRDKAKVNAANTAKVQGKQSAAAVHQNKANRHRKNSGPQAGGKALPKQRQKSKSQPKSPLPIPPPKPKSPPPIPPPQPKPPQPIPPPQPKLPLPIPPPQLPPPPSPCRPCAQAVIRPNCCMNPVQPAPPPRPPPPPPMPYPQVCSSPCPQTCAPNCLPQCCQMSPAGKR